MLANKGVKMPSTVSQLVASEGIELTGKVRWGEAVEEHSLGIYIVSLSDSEHDNKGILDSAPISIEAIRSWIHKIPTLTLDSKENPRAEAVRDRLAEFWMPDENILYVGKTDASLHKRVRDYYHTELGEPGPHAGGRWIRTLSNLHQLFIYYAICSDPSSIEGRVLRRFMSGVTDSSLSSLRDRGVPLPFANLRHPDGGDKSHGIGRSRRGRRPGLQSPLTRHTRPLERETS